MPNQLFGNQVNTTHKINLICLYPDAHRSFSHRFGFDANMSIKKQDKNRRQMAWWTIALFYAVSSIVSGYCIVLHNCDSQHPTTYICRVLNSADTYRNSMWLCCRFLGCVRKPQMQGVSSRSLGLFGVAARAIWLQEASRRSWLPWLS